jgi:predicted RNA-binding protein with PIN domain
LTILVGHQVQESLLLFDLFGVDSAQELKRMNVLPAYVPYHTETADLFTSFLEQIRYERADGAPMSIRVMTSDSMHYAECKNEIWVEDT